MKVMTWDELNKQMNTAYAGWILVSFSTFPMTGARIEQTWVITIESPSGERPTIREKIQIANVVAGDISTAV